MRAVKYLIICVFCLELVACGRMLHRYIPYEDEVYADKADNSPKPAEPVTNLRVPQQLLNKRKQPSFYAIPDSRRELHKREDLLLPPNNQFSSAS